MSQRRRVRRVTIQQVARAAGTSPSTVSRVLNGSAPVRDDIRGAVLHAIEALGYRPNLLARSLKTQVTHSLGLLINDILNPFYGAVARGLEERASESGYTVIFANTNEDPQRELAALQMLRDKAVDGIVLAPTGGNATTIASLVESGVALVQIDRRLADVRASAVLVDNAAGARAAVQHLLDQGHQRIGFVTYALERMSLLEREQGYRHGLHDAGIAPLEAWIGRVAFALGDVEQILGALCSQPEPPTALLLANNQIAVAVLHTLRQLAINIPDDLAVVVFDDLDWFALTHPTISAVAQPAYAIGTKAADLLLEQIAADTASLPHTVVFPPELMIRQSSQTLVGVRLET